MKAAVLNAPAKPLSIESVADPQPGPGEILIEVEACGVCHTDVHLAAAGKIRSVAQTCRLEEINEVLVSLRTGKVTGRVVIEFA